MSNDKEPKTPSKFSELSKKVKTSFRVRKKEGEPKKERVTKESKEKKGYFTWRKKSQTEEKQSRFSWGKKEVKKEEEPGLLKKLQDSILGDSSTKKTDKK
eukprot:snap_masked-scaffold_40-processed-gene-2.36-mRNA-1 protein AED:1.00 eAED:1.00 QI:0/-1/0/0/-1/1/1/0/99